MALILQHQDPNFSFFVEVYAYNLHWGCALTASGHIRQTLSICLLQKRTPAECNYDTGNRELLSIKELLGEWRHWKKEVDHKNMEYPKNAKGVNPCQAQWDFFYNRLNFTVTYHTGIKNSKDDALSHRQNHLQACMAQTQLPPYTSCSSPLGGATIDPSHQQKDWELCDSTGCTLH